MCRLIESMKNIGYIYQKNHIVVMDKLKTDIIQYFEFLCLSIIGQVKVNTTYQLLCRKLNMLSKYLYEERVKSKLKKEIIFLHDIQINNNMVYPFEHAEKFNSIIN
eukprot:XP_016663134.1 PREDICTED: WASH complex subunit 7-like [Acyrthosiphon pisum]